MENIQHFLNKTKDIYYTDLIQLNIIHYLKEIYSILKQLPKIQFEFDCKYNNFNLVDLLICIRNIYIHIIKIIKIEEYAEYLTILYKLKQIIINLFTELDIYENKYFIKYSYAQNKYISIKQDIIEYIKKYITDEDILNDLILIPSELLYYIGELLHIEQKININDINNYISNKIKYLHYIMNSNENENLILTIQTEKLNIFKKKQEFFSKLDFQYIANDFISYILRNDNNNIFSINENGILYTMNDNYFSYLNELLKNYLLETNFNNVNFTIQQNEGNILFIRQQENKYEEYIILTTYFNHENYNDFKQNFTGYEIINDNINIKINDNINIILPKFFPDEKNYFILYIIYNYLLNKDNILSIYNIEKYLIIYIFLKNIINDDISIDFDFEINNKIPMIENELIITFDNYYYYEKRLNEISNYTIALTSYYNLINVYL